MGSLQVMRRSRAFRVARKKRFTCSANDLRVKQLALPFLHVRHTSTPFGPHAPKGRPAPCMNPLLGLRAPGAWLWQTQRNYSVRSLRHAYEALPISVKSCSPGARVCSELWNVKLKVFTIDIKENNGVTSVFLNVQVTNSPVVYLSVSGVLWITC